MGRHQKGITTTKGVNNKMGNHKKGLLFRVVRNGSKWFEWDFCSPNEPLFRLVLFKRFRFQLWLNWFDYDWVSSTGLV